MARDTSDHPVPHPSVMLTQSRSAVAAKMFVNVPASADFPRRVLGVRTRKGVGLFLQHTCAERFLGHSVLSWDIARCGHEAEAFLDRWGCSLEEKTSSLSEFAAMRSSLRKTEGRVVTMEEQALGDSWDCACQ